jgi:ferredoxin
MIGVPEAIASGAPGRSDDVPAVLMVDRHLALQRVIVDDKLIREARRCREVWNNLQELGRTRATATTPASTPTAPAPPSPPSAASARQAQTATVAAPAPEARASDDPYIETPRCSTCNECTRINPNMFAYNENQQAFIKNPDAGTYAQLVEAAESCQLAIIHPGKPRNPNEPGLDALVARAEIFR